MARLINYVNGGEALIVKTITEPGDLQLLGEQSEALARAISSLENTIDTWAQMMAKMPSADRANEEATFLAFKVDDFGPATLLDWAKVTKDSL